MMDLQRYMDFANVFADPSQMDKLGRLWAAASIHAKSCATGQADTGRFVGTSFVARDIMSVANALGEDGMIRYWGQYLHNCLLDLFLLNS